LAGRNPKKLFLEEPLLGWGKLKPAAGKPLPEKMTAGIV
jgi:hypothetical protein